MSAASQQSFFQNAVFQVGLNLVVKGVYLFGVDRVVQNTLPEGDYGLYFSLLGLGMLVQVMADFGLQLHNARTLAGDRDRLTHYFPYFIGLKIILGVFFFTGLLAGGWLLGYRGWEIVLLVLAGAVQFLNSLVLYLRSNLSGLGWYRRDGWFSILDKSLLILSVGGILLFAPAWLTVTRFALLQLLAWGITAVCLLAVLWGRLPRKLPAFRRAEFGELLRGGAPFALAVVLATAYTRIDAVMVERLLPDGAAAAEHYAAGYRILDALNTLGWLLAGLLIPMYARIWKKGEDPRPLLRFSVPLLVVGAAAAAFPLAAYAQPTMDLLYHFAEARTGHVFVFLVLTFVAQSLNYAYGSLLTATGHIGRMNWIYAVGLVLNVAGNLWLLPRMGAPGAALMTLLTQGFVAIAQAIFTYRWLGAAVGRPPWRSTVAPLILHGTCVLALTHFSVPFAYGLPLGAAMGLVIMLAFKLIDPALIRSLLARD